MQKQKDLCSPLKEEMIKMREKTVNDKYDFL